MVWEVAIYECPKLWSQEWNFIFAKNNVRFVKSDEVLFFFQKALGIKDFRNVSHFIMNLIASCPVSKARACNLVFPNFQARTPMFMPVGTKGTIKGLTSEQLKDLDLDFILANTYHMMLKPGAEQLNEIGLKEWMGWSKGLLTDSGGFQMVSLLDLSKVTEEGVEFASHYDKKKYMLTPERSISIQHSIGADIIMQLDDVVNPLSSKERIEEAMWRSIRWLDRCFKVHNTNQLLFPIIQGGTHLDLRKKCLEEMIKRDAKGYAIGGLSGGEKKDEFWRTVSFCTDYLPKDKPRYCMGIGYALDIVVLTALGVDMFDCVFPTRTARFGNALCSTGSICIKQARYATDNSKLDVDCDCTTCKSMTRSQIHDLFGVEKSACHLLTVHNIAYMTRLTREMRNSIIKNTFPDFVRDFCKKMYPESTPQWAVDALKSVNIILNE